MTETESRVARRVLENSCKRLVVCYGRTQLGGTFVTLELGDKISFAETETLHLSLNLLPFLPEPLEEEGMSFAEVIGQLIIFQQTNAIEFSGHIQRRSLSPSGHYTQNLWKE